MNEKTIKQPYYITRSNNKFMAVAAIWETFKPEPKIIITSCCVLMTAPNELIG
ncbi:SOS response-associated peptidase family protein [Legionella hackeliae]|uniref:Uncharacterized protein n=1 Tax=Legionella hackeliae TaxID=449 RepID=A0A0A8UKL1_LEGHA|nr:SOS response-associated peptidase family protein [Legionella hackeliae]CEK09258.1 conserved protein of unknown function [Legionella hackeliae]